MNDLKMTLENAEAMMRRARCVPQDKQYDARQEAAGAMMMVALHPDAPPEMRSQVVLMASHVASLRSKHRPEAST